MSTPLRVKMRAWPSCRSIWISPAEEPIGGLSAASLRVVEHMISPPPCDARSGRRAALDSPFLRQSSSVGAPPCRNLRIVQGSRPLVLAHQELAELKLRGIATDVGSTQRGFLNLMMRRGSAAVLNPSPHCSQLSSGMARNMASC